MPLDNLSNNKYQYRHDKDTRTVIGDLKAQQFRPSLYFEKWSDCSFEIKYSDIEKVDFSLEKDIIKSKHSKIDMEFRPTEIKKGFNDLGGYDWIFVLKDNPGKEKIKFEYSLNNAVLYHQPALSTLYSVGESLPNKRLISSVTDSLVLDDLGRIVNYRPEHIVNSIAIYHSNKMDNQYKTGKLGHLYRLQVNDFEGKKIWADWSFDEKYLYLNVPKSFLDSAVYPITISPVGDTFGYTSIGGSIDGFDTNEFLGSVFTSGASAGTVDDVKIYCGNWGGDPTQLKAVIVLHSNLNIITNGVSGIVATPSGSDFQWETFTFSTAPSIAGSTEYVIGAVPWYYHGINYDSGDTNQRHYDTSNSFETPTNPTDAAHGNIKHSIYVDYTVVSAAVKKKISQAVIMG